MFFIAVSQKAMLAVRKLRHIFSGLFRLYTLALRNWKYMDYIYTYIYVQLFKVLASFPKVLQGHLYRQKQEK